MENFSGTEERLLEDLRYQVDRAHAMAAEAKLDGNGWAGRWSAALTEIAGVADRAAAALRRVAEPVDRVERLRAAVSIAEIAFDEYARLHRQKGTAEGDAKAKRNEEFSAKMSAALEDTRDASN